ncbi:ATP-binding protein [Maribellus mangrovi]|uniref:ATP-binding protein n=1 Tax=Maribellus mangrovi TaxID=3133146 RepID=UPI0030EC755B
MITDFRIRTLVFTLLLCCFTTNYLQAQLPVLTHSYTFEDGTAKDLVGNADGIITGGKIEDGKFVTTEEGQFIKLPAGLIQLSSYNSLTLEAFIVAGKDNGENTMVSYFGNEQEILGSDYIFQSVQNGANPRSRSAISCKNDTFAWNTETTVNCNPLNDGLPHYLVTTFNDKELRFYVDGMLVGLQTNEQYPVNRLENIGEQVAYLAKSGYRADQTWLGAIDAFNIYEGILDAATIEKSALSYLPEQVIANRYKLTGAALLIEASKIDSLRTLIDQSDNSEEKVRWLNEYARLNFYNQNYSEGFNATIEARDLARQLNFKGGEILYHYTLAAFFRNGDMYNYHIEKAKQLMSSPGNNKSYEEPVPPQEYISRWDTVLTNKLLALSSKYKDTGEKEIFASITAMLAYSYYATGRMAEAIEPLNKCVILFKKLGDPYLVILHYNFLNFLVIDDNEKSNILHDMLDYISSIKNTSAIGPLNFQMANSYRVNGQYELALKHYLSSLNYFESIKDSNMMVNVYWEMGNLYSNMELYAKQVENNDKLIDLLTRLKRFDEAIDAKASTIWALHSVKQYDKALSYINSALQDSTGITYLVRLAQKNELEANIAMDLQNYEGAIPKFKKALSIYVPYNNTWGMLWVNQKLALCYYNLGEYKTALSFAIKSMSYSEFVNLDNNYRKEINLTTSKIYEAIGDMTSAYNYLKKYQEVIDKEESNESSQGVFETLMSSALDKTQQEIDQLEQERTLKEQQTKVQRLWIFSITGALLSVLFLALVLYRNNKNKQKANKLLSKQKNEIQSTLEQLKSTQKQLIQSEKMASLGELTAGIAHEIQNPLNFINNFSEVNSELIEELKEEIKNGNTEEINELTADIAMNESKINYHGKRADSIVKGMLLHSRGNSGQKEATDINALADEYLRLSYHGFRAKDKSFNADFILDKEESLPNVKVVPQDIGRVLLNLINNAFYAVLDQQKQQPKDFKPLVSVSTKKIKNEVEIRVKDNGSGIPIKIKEKIFQPFFTTKPTGQGTGLGLSMSYDIITKGHNGTLKVESKEGHGTTFIIEIPITS